MPAISQNDTFCLNQNIRLTANGVGDIKWYKSQENGGTALFNGNVFNTAAVNKDTSFWVEDYRSSFTICHSTSIPLAQEIILLAISI